MEQTTHEQLVLETALGPNVWVASTKEGHLVVVKKVLRGSKRRDLNEERAGTILKGKEGIVDLLDSFEDIASNCTYLIFEYLNGMDLFSYLEAKRFAPLPEEEVKFISKQLVNALHCVHSHGIAHLDIKLENVMIDPETHRVTLIDFGLCEFVSSAIQKVTSWVGSQDYCSPEIIMRRPYQPFLADVYSLGVVIFTLLFGQLPFNYEEKSSFLMKSNRQPEIEWSGTKISPEAKELLTSMLQTDPLRRISLREVKHHPWFDADTNSLAAGLSKLTLASPITHSDSADNSFCSSGSI